MTMLLFVFLLIILTSLLSTILSIWTFDEIVKLEYKNHYFEWEKDGKPHGFVFVPKESKSFNNSVISVRSSFAFNRNRSSLFWTNPIWAMNEPKGLKLIFWYRISTISSLSGFLLLSVLIVFRY